MSTTWSPARRAAEFEPVPFDHPLWVLYSSGTTGLPKAIVHGHGGISSSTSRRSGCSRPRPRRPVLLVHHHGLDDVELPRRAAARGGDRGALRRQPGLAGSDALWALRRAPGDLLRHGRGVPQRVREGRAPARRDRYDLSRSRSNSSDRLAARRRAGSGGCTRRSSATSGSASMSGGTDVCTAFAGGNPMLPVHEGEMQAEASGRRSRPSTPTARRSIGEDRRAGADRADASMPVHFWNDPDGSPLPDAYFDTFPGVWRHGDWITSPTAAASSSHGGPTPR